jgi:hypothetical protein
MSTALHADMPAACVSLSTRRIHASVCQSNRHVVWLRRMQVGRPGLIPAYLWCGPEVELINAAGCGLEPIRCILSSDAHRHHVAVRALQSNRQVRTQSLHVMPCKALAASAA